MGRDREPEATAPRHRVARSAAIAAILACAASLPGCSKPAPRPKAELICRVVPGEGGRPIGEMDIRNTTGIIDLELGRLGFERREVMPMADGRIRIVLPESQIARMDEVRALLAEPRLRVTILE